MVISSTISVPANTRTTNIFAGEQFEFIPGRAALLRFRASAAVTGIRCDFQVGGESVLTNALVSNSNRFPIAPDDVLLGDTGGRGGERVFATYSNTTGAAIVVNYVLDIVPL
jgi:hypothetical protein